MIKGIHRFHGRSGLRFVYQHGSMVRGELLGLRVVRNQRQKTWRMAVVVSRKVSKSAVVRNRIRRRIYEIVRRESSARLYEPYDLVFSVYGDGLATMDHTQLTAMVFGLLDKAQLKPSQQSAAHDIVEIKETNA